MSDEFRVKSAILLSAGFATRLSPLSAILPKALFPVLNVPLIRRWLEKLAGLGVERVVVNVHYLAEKLEGYLDGVRSDFPRLDVIISREREILGTGGGIKKAAGLLEEPFFVLNSDIYTDLSLDELSKNFFSHGDLLGTIALGGFPGGTVSVGEGGRVLAFRAEGRAPGELSRLHGLGVMLLSPAVPPLLPDGFSDVIEDLNPLLGKGGRMTSVPLGRAFWSDMGTPGDYYRLNSVLAAGGRFVDEGAKVEGESSGFLVAGAGARVEKGARVENCVFWPGAVAESGSELSSVIVAGRARSGLKMRGGVVTGL
ncbi:MAG: NTP transferase domain-containing protein [Deltaproteobacteria bacterium]|jgi:mannose-1-phosphate guanylyltransferase|nr:NTP transferase domain-containing protein [Deltaproteobacteria bacterium]